MKMLNQVKLTFAGRSVNEGFARAALAAFLVQLDPTVPQLADYKNRSVGGRDQLYRTCLSGSYRPCDSDGSHL